MTIPTRRLALTIADLPHVTAPAPGPGDGSLRSWLVRGGDEIAAARAHDGLQTAVRDVADERRRGHASRGKVG